MNQRQMERKLESLWSDRRRRERQEQQNLRDLRAMRAAGEKWYERIRNSEAKASDGN